MILTKRGRSADPSIRKLEMAFLDKLTADDALPGLHIEPITNSADPRARTGRVNDNYRAVLFRLDQNGSPVYIYCGAFSHDEGTARAQRMTLKINPLNGIPEIHETEPTPSPHRPRSPRRTPPTTNPAYSGTPPPNSPASASIPTWQRPRPRQPARMPFSRPQNGTPNGSRTCCSNC